MIPANAVYLIPGLIVMAGALAAASADLRFAIGFVNRRPPSHERLAVVP